MGHARAYLTFDILRRILQDYFHYNVVYQVNITDVDDKIILRARQNYLVAEYKKQNHAPEAVAAFVDQAVREMHAKLQSKVDTLKATDTAGMTSKVAEKHKEALETAVFKLNQFQETAAAVEACDKTDTANLLQLAHDAVAAALDKEHGHSVTDRSIFEAHARHFEGEFYKDMAALGVRDPDVVTRVTEFVPQIVEYIQQIVDNGFGYVASDGSVYFDTVAFSAAGYDYRKLVPGVEVSEEEMAEGEGALASGAVGDKKHPYDFALWKASKPAEPAWDSVWGPGRPGWHIECSVMASDIFGNNLDIHGGGVDLKFPHHDNEMAQAEAYHKCNQWVNYFFHAGHLHIKGLKMSKSLKNFITIQQALQEHTARQLRFMFLLQPWDKSMNYSDQTVDDAKSKEKYFKNFFGAVKAVLRGSDFVAQRQGWDEKDRELHAALLKAQEGVHEALLDNFKTDKAVLSLVEVVQECNKYMAAVSAPKHLLVKKVALYVTKILKIFGLCDGSDEIGFGDGAGTSSSKEDTVAPFVEAFVDFRDKVRAAAKAKDSDPKDLLAVCDQVRDETMASLGVRVEDSGDSTVWKMDDPAAIAKEIEEKRRKQAEAKAQKLKKKIETLEKDLEKARLSAVPPTDLFKQGAHADKWGSYDDEGKPLTTKNGEELPKSQQKSITKELKNHEKAHEKLVKTAGGVDNIESYIAKLQEDLNNLKLESNA